MPFEDDDEEYGRSGGLVAKASAGDNAAPLSVSEISALLKRTVEDRFGFVRLRGELSGVKRAASGHLYCALKDEKAVIDGVMWRGGAQRLGFRPEDGIEVVATGKLTTYPGRSKYQIVIESMEIAGEGALLALLEKLRQRLAAEGLFDAGRKRAQPIIMTTVAMSLGMIPTALSIGADGSFRAPMGTVVIGGILLSTLLTLIIVPAGFSLAAGVEQRLGPRLRKRMTSGPDALPPEPNAGLQPAE